MYVCVCVRVCVYVCVCVLCVKSDSMMVVHFTYVGTSAGGEDVVSFTSVGVAREVLVTGLNLSPGLTYYATVKGGCG